MDMNKYVKPLRNVMKNSSGFNLQDVHTEDLNTWNVLGAKKMERLVHC
jgi:hypothetical protein